MLEFISRDSYNLSDSYGVSESVSVILVKRLNCCVKWLWLEKPTCKAMSAIAKSVFESIILPVPPAITVTYWCGEIAACLNKLAKLSRADINDLAI